MSDNLYFIPLTERALESDRPRAALREAFIEILRRGGESRYRQGLKQFCRFMETAHDTTAIAVSLERQGQAFAKLAISPYANMGEIGGILPGRYSVRLSTGRVIWERELSEQELFWAEAFGRRPIELAADTSARTRPYSIQEALLEGVLTLSVFPGIENGTIGIEFTPIKTDED